MLDYAANVLKLESTDFEDIFDDCIYGDILSGDDIPFLEDLLTHFESVNNEDSIIAIRFSKFHEMLMRKIFELKQAR